MPTLLLVRHGQASFGTDEYDRLSWVGTRQAREVANALSQSKAQISRIVTGDLRRQRETAMPIAAVAAVTPIIDARWNEYPSEDILASHSTSEARIDDPGALTSRGFQRVLDTALGSWIEAGDSTGATLSWTSFLERATDALDDAFAGLKSGETGVCVTSGGTIAAACTSLLGGSGETFLRLNRVVVNASVTRVIRGTGQPSLLSFNDHETLSAVAPELITYR